jgi:hypothetical protein
MSVIVGPGRERGGGGPEEKELLPYPPELSAGPIEEGLPPPTGARFLGFERQAPRSGEGPDEVDFLMWDVLVLKATLDEVCKKVRNTRIILLVLAALAGLWLLIPNS